jgi:hypothetical protein
VVGVVALAVGAVWWAFDADPARGNVILVLGLVAVVVGVVSAHRASAPGQRILFVIAGLLATLLVLDIVQLVRVLVDQRSAHSA